MQTVAAQPAAPATESDAEANKRANAAWNEEARIWYSDAPWDAERRGLWKCKTCRIWQEPEEAFAKRQKEFPLMTRTCLACTGGREQKLAAEEENVLG